MVVAVAHAPLGDHNETHLQVFPSSFRWPKELYTTLASAVIVIPILAAIGTRVHIFEYLAWGTL